jgi:hypothetical protein
MKTHIVSPPDIKVGQSAELSGLISLSIFSPVTEAMQRRVAGQGSESVSRMVTVAEQV